MTDAATSGKIDYLRGLKENVIIGRLIPTGERARLDGRSKEKAAQQGAVIAAEDMSLKEEVLAGKEAATKIKTPQPV